MTFSVYFRDSTAYSTSRSTAAKAEPLSKLVTNTSSKYPTVDTMTISDAALEKLSKSSNDWKEKIVANARANPQEGDSWLDAATSVTTDGPLLDISDPPKIKLSSTGEIWTPEKQKTYEVASKSIMQTRRDIYLSEKEKGAPSSEIMEKIFSYNDALPQWYKDGMNWR